MSKRYRDPEFLHEQYVVQRKSANEIAEICDVAPSTVKRWLGRHEINRQKRYQERDWLHEQYVEKRRDQQEIANECEVSKTTICHWLGRLGITDGESLKTGNCTVCGDSFRYYPSVRDGEFCSNNCANKRPDRREEVTCPRCEKTFERRISLDTEYCSMECWGKDYRTETDGYYGTLWQEQRVKALERDGYECSVCGITDTEHRNRFGRGLEVHHIVPVRSFASWDKPAKDAHVLRNLITVCRTHHPDAPGTFVDPESE